MIAYTFPGYLELLQIVHFFSSFFFARYGFCLSKRIPFCAEEELSTGADFHKSSVVEIST